MLESDNKVVIPGDILLLSKENTRPGKGTYEMHGKIYASLAGFVFVKEEQMNDKPMQVVEVRRSEEKHDHVIPYINGVVTARILNIGQKFAKCELLCVEETPLNTEFSAILRREDIRATDRDKIELPKCVQPGDLILARVISFGDNQTSFILSTAEDQLGVISGVSESGENMVAADWSSMKGVRSGVIEPRKVAQVPNLNKKMTSGFTWTFPYPPPPIINSLPSNMFGGNMSNGWDAYTAGFPMPGNFFPYTNPQTQPHPPPPPVANLVPPFAFNYQARSALISLTQPPPPPSVPPQQSSSPEDGFTAAVEPMRYGYGKQKHKQRVEGVNTSSASHAPASQKQAIQQHADWRSQGAHAEYPYDNYSHFPERPITPSFAGSGVPLVAGMKHDEMRPLVLQSLDVEQLNTIDQLERCQVSRSIPYGTSKGVLDLSSTAVRPLNAASENHRFPFKPKPDDANKWVVDVEQPSFSFKKTDKNGSKMTRAASDKTFIYHSSMKLIRKHPTPTPTQSNNTQGTNESTTAANAKSGDTVPTTSAAPIKRKAGLPVYPNNSGKNSGLPLSFIKSQEEQKRKEAEARAAMEKEAASANHSASALINRRMLAIQQDTDITWDDDTVVVPKQMKLEDDSISSSGTIDSCIEIVANAEDGVLCARPIRRISASVGCSPIRTVIDDDFDDVGIIKRGRISQSASPPSTTHRTVVMDIDTESSNDSSKSTSLVPVQIDDTVEPVDGLNEKTAKTVPESTAQLPTVLPRIIDALVSAAASSARSNSGAIVNRFRIDRTRPSVPTATGSRSTPASAPLSPAQNAAGARVSASDGDDRAVKRSTAYAKPGRGAMSLRIINGHRIGGDSRECYANIQGNCQAGMFCRFEHNGSREHLGTKVCARMLRGVCRPDNSDCPVFHAALLPHQYPVCAFFLRADCSVGSLCSFLHVKHSPNTQPCEEFNKGTCLRGAECEYPHRYLYRVVKERGCSDSSPCSSAGQAVAADDTVDDSTMRWIED